MSAETNLGSEEPSTTEPRPPSPADTQPEKTNVTQRSGWEIFAGADPRTLGLFRIVFGIFMLVDLYRRLPDLRFFYTNEGMLPNHGAIFRPMSQYLFSYFHAASTAQEAWALFLVTGVVFFVYMIGYRTRLFQILALIGITSLHSRNILLENGGDVVCNLLAFWTVFLPLGRRFSVDALLESLRASREQNANDLNDHTTTAPDRRLFVSLAYAAIILNLAVIYYFNTIHKSGQPWREGTTVHFVLWSDRLVQPLGVFVRSWLPLGLMKVMTIGTLVIEASIVLLLLAPLLTLIGKGKNQLMSAELVRACRRVCAIEIIALHSGFQTVGHFGLFSFVMMLHAILLVGPEDWDALAKRMNLRLVQRFVFYDASCGLCHQIARFLKRMDHAGNLVFIANHDTEQLPPSVDPKVVENSIVVSNFSKSEFWIEGEAVLQIFRAIPYGYGIARLWEIPGLRSFMGTIYRWVAEHRYTFSEQLGYNACGLPQSYEQDRIPPKRERPELIGKPVVWIREACIGFFMLAVVSQVIAENRAIPKFMKAPSPAQASQVFLPFRIFSPQPAIFAAMIQYPRLFQGWSMFAPVPPIDDGRIVVDATTVDGRHIDPLTQGKPVDFELPPAKEGMLVSQLWYEFHDRLRRPENARYRGYLEQWLINWQRTAHRPANDRIVAFKVYWLTRRTQSPGKRTRLASSQEQFMQWDEPASNRRPGIRKPIPIVPPKRFPLTPKKP
jgi:predicted DCC family thiol-disulfide oxidoreductase YuxK